MGVIYLSSPLGFLLVKTPKILVVSKFALENGTVEASTTSRDLERDEHGPAAGCNGVLRFIIIIVLFKFYDQRFEYDRQVVESARKLNSNWGTGRSVCLWTICGISWWSSLA